MSGRLSVGDVPQTELETWRSRSRSFCQHSHPPFLAYLAARPHPPTPPTLLELMPAMVVFTGLVEFLDSLCFWYYEDFFGVSGGRWQIRGVVLRRRVMDEEELTPVLIEMIIRRRCIDG